MSVERVYRVEETLTIVGVGWVRARSKAEAIQKASEGGVEFAYNDGQDIRRGDGLKAFVQRENPDYFDPTPTPLPESAGNPTGTGTSRRAHPAPHEAVEAPADD